MRHPKRDSTTTALFALLALLACRSTGSEPSVSAPASGVKAGSLEYAGEAAPASVRQVDLTPQMLYEKALRLERRDRFPEAIACYERLLALTPGHEDSAARRAALVELVEMAEVLYAEALAAEDDSEACRCLELIRQFWPGYRDVPQRLAAADRAR